ncbi:MAG TPA: hypothetical protein PK600_07875 [Deltaproteobacteria bacterium]|nr:hypothetical protein [Deltaproteobacteria bacterium]
MNSIFHFDLMGRKERDGCPEEEEKRCRVTDDPVEVGEHADRGVEEEGKIGEVLFPDEDDRGLPECPHQKRRKQEKTHQSAMQPGCEVQIMRMFYEHPIAEPIGELHEYALPEKHALHDDAHRVPENLDPVRCSPDNYHVVEKTVALSQEYRREKRGAAEHKEQFGVSCQKPSEKQRDVQTDQGPPALGEAKDGENKCHTDRP